MGDSDMLDERIMRNTLESFSEVVDPPAPLFSPALKAALNVLEQDLRDFLRADRQLRSAATQS